MWGVRERGRGGDGGKDTVGFTDVLKAEVPPPSPPRAAGTRGTLSPCPTGGGKGGGQFVRGSGQLCHLLAGVRSGRGGRGRGGLYSVPPAAVTAGVPGGEEDTPHRHPPSPPPRAPVHVALGGGGQRTLRFPRPLVGQPGGSWGGALLWPEGGHRAGQRRGGRAARSEPTPRGAHRHAQRAPPRFAGESASSRLLSTPLVSISRLAPPLGGADRGDSFPTDRPRPAPLSPIGPRSGLFRLVLRLLVTFREATFLWG